MALSHPTVSIAEARKQLDTGEINAVELTKQCLQVVKERDETIHAYVEVFEEALETAKEADKAIARGQTYPLLGIPIALKDNILQKGKIASAGSTMLKNYTAAYDATATNKLKKQRAVLLGRTNMDDAAMGSSTETSVYGITRNPHDEAKVSGGSSGGSAAAVTIGAALGAYGSDTGGSVRQPAGFCGVVGFKPTYGNVSRHGLIALGSSLDVIGQFGKTVSDAQILYEAVTGHDPLDSTSIPDNLKTKITVPDSLTIGVPRHFLAEGVDPAVLKRFDETLQVLKDAGHRIKEIELPNVKYSLAAYYIVLPAEASSNLARYDGIRYGHHAKADTLLDDYQNTRREGFGEEVRRRIMLGTYVLSAGYYDAFYGKAHQARDVIRTDYKNVYNTGVDVIATPTTPTTAFKIGEKSDPVSMYLADIFTVPANITGQPAMSVPMGTLATDGVDLPIGIQFIAPHLHEQTLFTVGREVEKIYT